MLAAVPGLHAAGDQWELALREDFDSAKCLPQWSLDGPADVSVTPEGKLSIETKKVDIAGKPARCSVLWHKQPIWGDLRIEFDAKAEHKSRCLFLFAARSTDKDRSIFNWKRPRADYGDYAYERRLELYSMGILRSDQKTLNLRHLGGSDVTQEFIDAMPYHPLRFPERWLTKEQMAQCMATAGITALPTDARERTRLMRRPPFKQALAPHVQRRNEINKQFQEISIIASHTAEPPVFGDPAKFYRVAITVRGVQVTISVDGKQIVDFTDTRRAPSPLAGGYFGFRNFVPTEAQYDNLRVYRLSR